MTVALSPGAARLIQQRIEQGLGEFITDERALRAIAIIATDITHQLSALAFVKPPKPARLPKSRAADVAASLSVQRLQRELADQQERAERARTARVYFIEAIGQGCVKIGVSINVERRLNALEAGTGPGRLRLLLDLPGGYRLESELHKRFAQHAMGREWFRLAPEVAAYVTEMQS